ncbi:hypothetical protein Ancab_008627 [Ancistrocladus abbreviatus]
MAMGLSLAIAVALGALSLLFFCLRSFHSTKLSNQLPPVPKVPGLPLLGNLLQLKDKKPFKTFTRWAQIYGPIYSIKLGSSSMIVLNNNDVAKEAMVTRYSSISTRKLSYALKIITYNKFMVAVSDYNEFHKTIKRHILNSLLGPRAQKNRRHHRETMVDSLICCLNAHVAKPNGLNQATLGLDVKSVYVEELGTTLSLQNILHILVLDVMEAATEVDWRDFFTYLRWIPNKKLEARMKNLEFRRHAVMKVLINERKKQVDVGGEINCYLDYLLVEEKTLTEKQLAMLVWEPIIQTSDTTLITTEWAMFELAKDPNRQDRLYQEIQKVCRSEKITEEHLSNLPYLGAIFHETLRKHTPAALIPLRYVHEDTHIGGYHIPAGSEICVNLHGCNKDKNEWKNPEVWNPERFLVDEYEPQDLYKTMAFGAGKRVCTGALQAMLIVCLSIGRLVQDFEWRLEGGEEEDLDTVGFTTHKLHPLHAIIKPRS